MTSRATIDEFLAQDHLAFVGVSRDPKEFSSTVFRELRDKGRSLLPVNPNAEEILGDHCFHSVAELPADVDGAIVMVPAERSASVVQECIDRGIPRVWLHKGIGPSSVSTEAVDLCHEHRIQLVEGECPLMYAEPVGTVHRIHRFGRRVTGRLPR